jgi:hypothetical protein
MNFKLSSDDFRIQMCPGHNQQDAKLNLAMSIKLSANAVEAALAAARKLGIEFDEYVEQLINNANGSGTAAPVEPGGKVDAVELAVERIRALERGAIFISRDLFPGKEWHVRIDDPRVFGKLLHAAIKAEKIARLNGKDGAKNLYIRL